MNNETNIIALLAIARTLDADAFTSSNHLSPRDEGKMIRRRLAARALSQRILLRLEESGIVLADKQDIDDLKQSARTPIITHLATLPQPTIRILDLS